jgi:tRNA(fMet)-specific endonuclease VapC
MAIVAVALDTNAYTAFMLGRPEARAILGGAHEISLSAIVIGELLAGFAAGARESKNRAELGKFLSSPRVKVRPITEGSADYYARVYSALRRKGRPIPTNDLWVAASALEHGLRLYTYDAHFAEIDGLISGHLPEMFFV